MVLFRGDIKCKSLQRRTSLSVILPADNIHYLQGTEEIAEKPYKTLYLLHGLFGSDDIFLANTTIQKFAEDHNIAVVLPSGENSFYVDQKESHKYYGEFIGRELVEMTRNIFPLSHKKEDTYLAGFSMGGYGAYRLALGTDHFSYAASLSGVLTFDGMEENFKENPAYWGGIFGNWETFKGSDNEILSLADRKQENKPKLYAWCGKQDFLFPGNEYATAELKKLGFDITYESSDGVHEWYYWTQKIESVLKWLPINYKQEERLS